jgi:hypothetical protein
MKTYIYLFSALCSLSVFVSSCSVSQNSIGEKAVSASIDTENKNAVFVKRNDGSVTYYTSLKLVTGILKTPHLLADDKEIINSKDIMAYKDQNVYAVSSKLLTSKKNSYVASEALPGFAVKLVSGKLNVYCRKYYNGGSTTNEYFLQSGEDGYIVSYSKDVLKSMLKEDKKALDYFNKGSKMTFKPKKLIAVVELFNNNQMLTKN